MLLDKLLLVGEPDGAGTIADPPAPDPEPAPQPEPEPPASDDAPADGEDAPAADGDDAPESEDFTPEERRALLERLKDSDEFKELVPKDEPKPEKPAHPLITRQDDPMYRAIAQDVGSAYEQITATLKKLSDPNAQVMQSEADTAAALMDSIGHFQALAERRGQLTTITMIAMRELGVEGDFDEKNPIHGELEQAIADIEQKMTHNYRQRGRLLKEIDPGRRQQMAQSIEESDAGLVGGFLNNVIKLAAKHGETQGMAKAEKDFDKRQATAVTLAKSNGNVEATARARRVLAGAVAQSSANTPSKTSSGPLTIEEAQTLSIEELKRRGYA